MSPVEATEQAQEKETKETKETEAQNKEGAGQGGVLENLQKDIEDLKGKLPVNIYGGITGIVQGSLNNRKEFGGDDAEGTLSTDLFIDSTIFDSGYLLLRFDVELGAGLTAFPPVFTNPDGNATGPNNDVETFNNPESLNINEARYTQSLFGDHLAITFGQIDLTSFMDENNYANKETFQYIAQTFNNSITIDWGGSVNFFGPGVIVQSYLPITNLGFIKELAITLGAFEGDGNYKNVFDHPFFDGELSIKTDFRGREGNYRFYGWTRRTPHCRSVSDPTLFLNCDLIAAADRIRIKGSNTGVGASLDQQISDSVGFWARLGFQDPDVSQFGSAFSVGLVSSGSLINRPNDALGVAYGIIIPSSDYKDATGFSDVEHYVELYYKFVVSGDGSTKGLHLTPDFQIVVNPGGNGAVHPVFVPGLRAQVHF